MKRGCRGLRSGAARAAMSLHQQDQLRQAFLLNRPYPAFRIGVQIRTSGRQGKGLHASCFDDLTKRGAVIAVAIMQQVVVRQNPVGIQRIEVSETR